MAFSKDCPLLPVACDCGINYDKQTSGEEGVSRVRVTSRRSSQKVERVAGLVSRSHVEAPKEGYEVEGRDEEKAAEGKRVGEDGGARRGPVQCNAVRAGTDT
ncbi:hypothetical protein DPX16_19279 [Anabarilius grahami]|uniref:Uncharacterized protein n=1 Tax=Anabarilius grahami TaxID=495550 RepID=A0A3N0YZY7_ANAGA|nr:hypothetical protein DPX16_19279 [Anabarilius grahami]